jgi:hypothetical protein
MRFPEVHHTHSRNYETLARSVTIANPLALPFSMPSDPVSDLPLRKDDYPDVRFWMRQAWSEFTKNKGTSDLHQQRSGERGRSRAAQGVNVTMRYVEDEHGHTVDGHRASEMRKIARSIWVALANAGKAPAKWSQADLGSAESYRREMRRHFPELRLCDNDWKADLIASEHYPSWYSHHDKHVKLEDADVKTFPAAKRSQHNNDQNSLHAAKKTRLESTKPESEGAKEISARPEVIQPLIVCVISLGISLADLPVALIL